ncbi:hypothetical protein N6H14_06560 [Paenibacillus sp. CC-CFT747]|nr:hypothetical protein N6H14_06560 [Paenibacillus sp. CC-CFT747]
MIRVQGMAQPIDPAMLPDRQRDIYLQKDRSPTVYSYDSVDQLLFELRVRVSITEAAAALYESGAQFATFADSRCNPVFWDRTEPGDFS